MGQVFNSLNFDHSTADDLMKLEKQHAYSEDYDYEIKKEGIQVDASKLFKLIFQTCYGDNTSMHMLMDMLAPLFREVTGGHAIIKIATILAKGRKDKIFSHMSNLVRLIIVGMITDKIEKKHNMQKRMTILTLLLKIFIGSQIPSISLMGLSMVLSIGSKAPYSSSIRMQLISRSIAIEKYSMECESLSIITSMK